LKNTPRRDWREEKKISQTNKKKEKGEKIVSLIADQKLAIERQGCPPHGNAAAPRHLKCDKGTLQNGTNRLGDMVKKAIEREETAGEIVYKLFAN